MAVEIQTKITVTCDGPNCSATGTTTDSAHPVPEGWLPPVYGPSEFLGQFHFHSGACYDKWKKNLDAHLAQEAK